MQQTVLLQHLALTPLAFLFLPFFETGYQAQLENTLDTGLPDLGRQPLPRPAVPGLPPRAELRGELLMPRAH